MKWVLVLSVLAAGCAGHHWSYVGDSGPANWGKFASVCAEGKRQSPIDLSGTVDKPLGGVDFAYHPAPAHAINNGHTIQVRPTDGGSVTFNGQTYPLTQFHFHHPSEHTIDGQRAPMELHLVHETPHGALAVGVMLVDGTGGASFEPIFNQLPRHEGDETQLGTIDATTLLPADRSFVTYPGSLTTPPCGESVTWVVLRAPVTISRAQLEAFSALFPDNSRPIQPRNGRTIETPQKAPQ
jgi:carbonic anhydrase